MSNLPMPSDLTAEATTRAAGPSQTEPVEPPSAKLLVRLFLIPFVIVALAVGVMFLIGLLAGGTPTVAEAVQRLKNPGGARTADFLLGPGSKQRYIDAKTLVDQMKSGMGEAERIKLSDDLVDILDHHSNPDEGEVRHFLLLALGRVWQVDPREPAGDSPQAVAARKRAADALLRYAGDPHLRTRKAALLAMAYWAGRDETSLFIPKLSATIRNGTEDIDSRIAAATVLGPIGSAEDQQVISALRYGMDETRKENVELVWNSALSLAQLGQEDVSDTILQLLDRKNLQQIEYFDRESDPRNPYYRTLSEQEQQRILINAMIGGRSLPAVQARLKEIEQSDSSPRVRAMATELLQTGAVPTIPD